ncbi:MULTISPECIES: amino acid permease [Streptomyces]|uniref:amino acid permease n=1 Tax=Streptomyces scabiei TaxID=1930 RepID=UPI0004E67AD5|nr:MULTISPECIES: amino acid permease [Streptomyces]KFG09402.1 transporter [Streptomyces scabiei]MBP5879294.1 amino acid permease [Streptomyces sp. LBUM 1477]MBP5887117.1 amino acid permease [Streptomyces sp. LBUM 1487]MBP5890298.1 amino acid permease [Streptomyces sp. LBUM 1481]MBP5903115.1 amino acid permease [Streptomyces sp. LBUM 1488]
MTTTSTPEATEPEPAPATGTEATAASGPVATGAAAPGRKFGVVAATALVMGNIIGGGIFTLPATVAPYGTVSLLAFGVLSVAAVLLALLFGKLARRSPVTGGLYVYPRDAFGPFAGFLSAWSYWTMCWVSIAALAVGVVGYVDVLIPLGDSKAVLALVALAALWLPAAANFAGTRYVGAVQVVSTVLKFVPLLLVATIGLFFVDADNYGPFNASGESTPGALAAAAALLLYSFLGVESAAVSAGEVKDPERTVGRASVLGTLASALVYILGTVAVFGLVPHKELVDSGAPFADAVNAMAGGSWGGTVIALVAVASIVGCLNGWVLLSAQMPYAAARDGLFPQRFARVGKGGVPGFGVLATAVLGTLLIVINYADDPDTAFRVLVLITTFTGCVPYLLSAAAQLYWLARGTRERVRPAGLVRDLIVAGLSFAFSFWLIAGAGYAAVYQGALFLFAGIPVYVWLRGRQEGTEETDAGNASEGGAEAVAEVRA